MRVIFKRYNPSETGFAAVLLAPLLLGLGVFYMYPLFRTIFYSFTRWGMFGGHTWIGLSNYVRIISDIQVWSALKNTVIYAFCVVPLSIVLAILISCLLNGGIRGLGIYRTIFFLPAVTIPAAIALVWRYTIYEFNSGILNSVISFFGGTKIGWLTNPGYVMLSLVVVGVWGSLGRAIVIFLAGLQGIHRSYYEAAEIDGAGVIHRFFSITLPLLTPVIFFTLLTQVIAALQVYDLIYMMFSQEGNPAMFNVQSLVYVFYRNAFIINDKGYASAIAVLLLLVTMVFTVVNFAGQKKWVHYD